MLRRSTTSAALVRLLAAAVVFGTLFWVSSWSTSQTPLGTPSAFAAETSPSVTPSSTPTPPAVQPVDHRPKAPKFVTKKGKAIYLDRAHQRVYLYVDGRQIDKFKCSTSSTLPRRGTYHVKRRRRQSWSFSFTVTFYYQTIFAVGPHGHNIAFHSVPVTSSGHEIAPLGQPVSHGCVRVPYKKAKFIYYWINKKTPIIVRP